MNDSVQKNPAEQAAQLALEQVYRCIDSRKNFRLEAGAGAGKTYSLIKALNYLIEKRGKELLRAGRRIACITYTNVAKDEIIARTDGHPAVLSETIHSFCWQLLKDFQPSLRIYLPTLSEKWAERFAEVGEIGVREVIYDLGYPKIEDDRILLHHDDVPKLMVKLLELPKFRQVLVSRFPYLLIDEYQDTDKDFANAIKTHFIETESGPTIGLFGDHWQKIYGSSSCGIIESGKIISIGKQANFRSDRLIVDALNRFRPELIQHIKNPDSLGSISVFHTNNWSGQRRSESHWKGDLPVQEAHSFLLEVRSRLERDGWNFSPQTTKILMLTHNILADEQGYKNLVDIFPNKDSLIKKENEYIAFFVDTIEPFCQAYSCGQYGLAFSVLGSKLPLLKKHKDKDKWKRDIDSLVQVRSKGSIGDVIELLQGSKRPRLPEKIEGQEKKSEKIGGIPQEERLPEDIEFIERQQRFKQIPYAEVIALEKFIQDKTPFATKHGVKGAEFENVLVVCGRGWNQYNFGQFLEWIGSGVPSGKQEAFERNRNLFYVACSRPKNRLAIFFSQELTTSALLSLKQIFGNENIIAL